MKAFDLQLFQSVANYRSHKMLYLLNNHLLMKLVKYELLCLNAEIVMMILY